MHSPTKGCNGFFTANFIQSSPIKTEVIVNVKLQAVQAVLLAREESNENVESYLRKQLYDKISANLSTSSQYQSQKIVEQVTTSVSAQSNNTTPSSMSVSQVQKKLTEMGYQLGLSDGVMGKKTIAAIRNFQKDNKLPVTGQIDKATIEKLSK